MEILDLRHFSALDLRAFGSEMFARRADAELTPAPKRQEERGGRGQPPWPESETPPRLHQRGFTDFDAVHDVLASLRRRRDWLEVECHRCKTRASLPPADIRRPRDTPTWKIEAALKCRSRRTPRYSPPVRMIKLTQQPELSPYVWVHPEEER